jgi:hypothetical protein
VFVSKDTPCERLAKAVIIKAVKDYLTYNSVGAPTIRKAWAKIKRDPDGSMINGESTRYGLSKFKVAKVAKVSSVLEDPGPFLRSNSMWHQIADVDPSKFANIEDPKWRSTAREAVWWSTNKTRLPFRSRAPQRQGLFD